MSKILDLPDEILCEVFQYLTAFDALYSFININGRLQCLLRLFKQEIDLTSLTYRQFMQYIDEILPQITKEETLSALKLGNKRTPGQIELFNNLIDNKNYFAYFRHVSHIIIEETYLHELIQFVHKYSLSLTNLSKFSIKIGSFSDKDFQTCSRLFVNSILSMPNLTKITLEMPSGLVLSHLPDHTIFDSLTDITLPVTLVTDFMILVQSIPNAENLSINIAWWSSGDQTLVRMLKKIYLNDDGSSLLKNLKTFHLNIDSILAFQYQHFEQVLHKIMNKETTNDVSFSVKHNLDINDQLEQLINGNKWEHLLSIYPLLTRFNLIIRLGKTFTDQHKILSSFRSQYFLERKWSFHYSECSTPGTAQIYSIPYRNKHLFDLSINNAQVLNSLPINYGSNVFIDSMNQQVLHLLSNHFPKLETLKLLRFKMNHLIMNPLYISSLHTLRIEREANIDINHIHRLFPSINTLCVSYFTIYCSIQPSEMIEYKRINELSIYDILGNNIDRILPFFNRFPNLHHLHLQIRSRRINNKDLLIILNKILDRFHSLKCFMLQLDDPVDSSIDWKHQFNCKVKMYLTETIFDGRAIYFWF